MNCFKLLKLFGLAFATTLSVTAQVGIGTASPDASSALEISSTTQGFLLPRMTGDQRNAITAPAQGLMVYCINCGTNGEAQLYNGTSWVNLHGGAATTALGVGSSYGGGIVAYIFVSGDPGYISGEWHGLIAAAADQSTGITWHNSSLNPQDFITYASGLLIGTGQTNTNTVVSAQGSSGTYAAKICDDLVLGGFSDWYLPSKGELNKLYLNRVSIGGFSSVKYWSSSEYDSALNSNYAKYYAWRQDFSNNDVYYESKSMNSLYVRAVRSF